MKLYHFALSPFSAKVRIALAEKGLDYESVDLPINRTGFVAEPPEVARYNPRREVPILVDGELTVYDSTVILEYLEDRHPQPALYPSGAAERARCRQLEDAGDDLATTGLTILIDELWRKTDPADADAERVSEGRQVVTACYDRLDAALEDRPFLCEAFTVADISCWVPTMMASFLGVAPQEKHARVAAWLERCNARPSIAADLAATMAANAQMAS